MATERAVYAPDLDKMMKDLKKLNPELRKDFNKALNRAVAPVRDEARRLVPTDNPVRNWRQVEPTYTYGSWQTDTYHRSRDFKQGSQRWTWRPIEVRRGIKITRTKFRTGRSLFGREEVTALAIINSYPGGVIYELTGAGTAASRRRTKNVSRNPNAPRDFELAMNRRGKPRRLLYKAAESKGQQAMRTVQDVMENRLFKFTRG